MMRLNHMCRLFSSFLFNYLKVDDMIKIFTTTKVIFNHRHHDLVILPEIIDVTN